MPRPVWLLKAIHTETESVPSLWTSIGPGASLRFVTGFPLIFVIPRPSLRVSLALLCVAGALLRVVFLVQVPLEPVSDFARYLEVASNLAQGQGMSAAGRPFVSQPPLYPGLLGGWFSLFGVSVASGKVLNLVLATASLVLWAWVCPRSGMRPGWQMASLAVLAFHPALVSYTALLGTETLSVFLAVVAFALTCLPGRPAWKYMLLGLFLALIALNRPQMLPLPVLAAVGWALGRNRGGHVRASLLMLTTFAVAMTPWTLRNAALFDQAVPVSANSGYVMMVNNNSANQHGGWMPLSALPLSSTELAHFREEAGLSSVYFAGADEDSKILRWTPAADQVARSIAVDWIVSHPGRFLDLALQRMEVSFDPANLMYWPFNGVGGSPRWVNEVTRALNVVLCLLAVIAAFRLSLRLRQLTLGQLLALGMLALGGASILVFEGQGRYLIPLVPAMLWLVGTTPRQAAGPG